jgi:hypothetical protein
MSQRTPFPTIGMVCRNTLCMSHDIQRRQQHLIIGILKISNYKIVVYSGTRVQDHHAQDALICW